MAGEYVMLFDGDCGICQTTANWVARLDRRRHRITCLPAQRAPLAELHPGLTLAECLKAVQVVTPDGQLHAGWDAVVALAPALWIVRPLEWADRVPALRRLCERAYDWIARNRYRLSRGDRSCPVPPH